MKRFLSIAVLAAVGAAAVPLSAAAQTRVYLNVGEPAPVYVQERYYVHDRYAPERQYRGGYAYAPSGWDTRHGRYVESRRWVDRNRDGMHDRRGGRDFDRDGVPNRYDRDLDNDGIANRYDRDVDGDGVRNRRDRRPENPYAY
ncbi:thrombospondin type 3 repeat-containing protein [Massilia niabensis]|uniref:Thrombospondin type 3 repeat-containing protein n=1 Tax=Massilia niabensis TaxID=544910 RepID=A0ABW0KYE2_9BURK